MNSTTDPTTTQIDPTQTIHEPCINGTAIAPNEYTCLIRYWDWISLIILVTLSIYFAVLFLCQKAHRRGILACCCSRHKREAFRSGYNQRVHVSKNNVPSSPQQKNGDSAKARSSIAVLDLTRWLILRWPLELFRLFSILLLAVKLCAMVGLFPSLNWRWQLVFVPTYVVDLLVLVILKWTKVKTIFQSRLLWGYTWLLGFPLGTTLKVLLATHLDSFEKTQRIDLATPIAVISLLIAVGIVVLLTRLALVEYAAVYVDQPKNISNNMIISNFSNSGHSTNSTTSSGSNSFAVVQKLSIRPWYLVIIMILPVVYFAFAIAMSTRVVWKDAGETYGLENDRYDYDRSIFILFPVRNWFTVLMPVWLIAIGSVVASVGDLVCEVVAAPSTLVYVKLHFHLTDTIPLAGLSAIALACVYVLDHHDFDEFSGVAQWFLIAAAVLELFSLVNLVLLTVRVQRLRKAQSNSAMNAEQVRDSLRDSDLVSITETTRVPSEMSHQSIQSSTIHLRESNTSADDTAGNLGFDIPPPAAARSNTKIQYGKPYIDNPTFVLNHDGDTAQPQHTSQNQPPQSVQKKITIRKQPTSPTIPLHHPERERDRQRERERQRDRETQSATPVSLVPLRRNLDSLSPSHRHHRNSGAEYENKRSSTGFDLSDDEFEKANRATSTATPIQLIEFDNTTEMSDSSDDHEDNAELSNLPSEFSPKDDVVEIGVTTREQLLASPFLADNHVDPFGLVHDESNRLSISLDGHLINANSQFSLVSSVDVVEGESKTKYSIISGGTDQESIAGDGFLSRNTVKVGLCVRVDAQFADPRVGLYGDTVACDGMLGVVQQWDNSDSCKVHLADGRQQWMQCQALLHIQQPSATNFSGFSDPISAGMGSLFDLATTLTAQQGQSRAFKQAIEHVEMNRPSQLREVIIDINPGEINSISAGKSLLQMAAQRANLEVVTVLVECGADTNIVDNHGNAALHYAGRAGNAEDGAAVAASLLESGADVNHQNNDGYSAIHLAAESGRTIMAELLVAMSCQSNLRTRDTNETALFFALKVKNMKIIRLLVEQACCDVNVTDGDGDTPLHLAFSLSQFDPGTVEIANYLIDHGANAITKNQQGLAALDVCPDFYFNATKQRFITAQVSGILATKRNDVGIAKGCRVRLKNVTDLEYGAQGIGLNDELVVRDVVADTVLATFIDPASLLRFKIREIYRVFDSSGTILTCSSNPLCVNDIFNPDREAVWQSDGERGQHWICLQLPHVGDLSCFEIQVDQGGVAFIPKRIEIHVGETKETLKPFTSTEVVSYGWTAIIPNNCNVKARFVKLLIRSCHESGINCRVSGLRMQYTLEGELMTVPTSHTGFEPLAWEDVNVGHDTGKVLKGRYRLGQKLAQGGFGITYVASDEDCLNEQVLIKFLHRLPGLELFRREARRLLDINHPQIPRLKAYFELKDEKDENPADATKSKFALVMEMIHGRDLQQILDDAGVWDEHATYAMLISVWQVLAHVHHKGIVHRDVKAANIMRRETDGVFFVIDFGACTTESGDGSAKAIGTPGYMAPEAVHGKSCCESDLYSLGAMGIYMLTGTEPYRLMDKTTPSAPFQSTLDRIRYEGTVSHQTFSLLNALLQPDPSSRRLALNSLQTDITVTVA